MAATGVSGVLNVLGPVVLLISALLTAGYLMPIVIRGFFPGEGETFEKKEPSYVMLVPLCLLAGLSVLLGAFPDAMINLFSNLAAILM